VRAFILRQLDWSMLRWAIVGTTTFIIDYTLFIFLYGPITSVFAANFVAAGIATTLNYLTHHRWTFKSDEDHSRSGAKYIATLVFWWFIGTSILKLLIVTGLDPRLAKIVPVLIVTPFNYFVLNHLVFKKSSHSSSEAKK
jgi:putative flippase GtrA